jgi:hypothetical protein
LEDRILKIYLAGPMRGIEAWNFPAFDAAEARWREAGHQVFSPAQMDRVLKYEPTSADECCPGHLRHVIQLDLACVLASDAVALLPGWQRSRGAAVEVALAQFLGLPLYDAETMQPLKVPTTPWGELSNAIRAFRANGHTSCGVGAYNGPEAARPVRGPFAVS